MIVEGMELKNCPFCGIEPCVDKRMKLIDNDRIISVNWFIYCKSCGCKKTAPYSVSYDISVDDKAVLKPIAGHFEDGLKTVVELWNERN